MSKAFGKLKDGVEKEDRVTFGKHTGNTWAWVSDNFPDYIIWCVGNTDNNFSKDLIVAAIKSKYEIKKRNKTEEVDGEYVPQNAVAKGKSFGHNMDSVLQKHHGDSFDSHHSDDWDDDIPF